MDRRVKHGKCHTREYKIWEGIKKRCYSPTCKIYSYYGGRGITMCEEWRNDFMSFYNDMGTRPSPKHSLDRIDNDKGYCKDNCRWVTKEVQANNTRTNVFIEYKGKRQTLAQWSKELGIPMQTFHNRIKNGLPMERVMYPGKLHKYLVLPED